MSNLWKSKMEDDALIERFLSGDEEGFEMLVKKYQNQVVNIVYSLSGATSCADDIAQEVFIKVHRALGSFRKRCEFATWLYRITVNTAYNYIKKEKRYLPSGYIQETGAVQQRPLRELEIREKEELISKALKRLPFNFRTAIVLKEIEGLSYKEIAKTMRCSIGTVESRLFRARDMLKRMLSPIIKEGVENELR